MIIISDFKVNLILTQLTTITQLQLLEMYFNDYT